MLILHAIASLDPAAGGPPQVAYYLARAQASLGHEVHLVAYRGVSTAHQGGSIALGKARSTSQILLHQLPTPNRSERILGLAARHFFRNFLPKADVLHLHGVWESILRLGAAEARRQGKSYVVAPHGMLDPWSLAQRRWKKRVALVMGYRTMLNRASFLHCLNADEARLLAPLHLVRPTRTIPNGVFPEEFAQLPARGTFRRLHAELGDAPYVLFLSRLHYKKGLDYLARAFGILATKVLDLQLVVVGPDGGARGELEAGLARAGLTARAHVLGPLYDAEKLAALVDAAVFCLPSRQEGFSMAILEAMACGTPVVISENCHFPEVALSSAGYVVSLEAETVADAILSVLVDPAKAKQMGQAGQKMVREHYTWPEIARLSIDSYTEVRSSG
jgi:glycosyltransferase involved in cell wall biosynthesis